MIVEVQVKYSEGESKESIKKSIRSLDPDFTGQVRLNFFEGQLRNKTQILTTEK